MANPTNFPGDIVVPGNIRVSGNIEPAISKANILDIAELQAFNVPWTIWRTWDAVGTNLPGAAANDDLGLVGGTFGTNHISIQAGDVGGTTSTRYARGVIALPWEYVAAQTVTIRCYAGVQTTVCDGSCTLDVEAYIMDGDYTLGADVVSTTATTMNSTSFANLDFSCTATNLSPGSQLDVRLTVDYADTGDAGVMIPTIGLVQLLADVR